MKARENPEISEIIETLEKLEQSLIDYEDSIKNNRENASLIHIIFRYAHNLKSSLTIIGKHHSSEVIHLIENNFDKILNDRNLIVHHGGVITSRYTGQSFVKKSIKDRVFFDSLVITRSRFLSDSSFFESIAEKIIKATDRTLKQYINENNINLSKEGEKALFFINWWD